MEQLIDRILVHIQSAFAIWGWWCLLIIGATFLIMVGVNALLKFFFRKAETSQLQGTRKALSSLSVFGVAIGVIYLFGLFDTFSGATYTFGFVVSNSIPVAFCAMTLWAIVKAVGRVGILPLFNAIWKKVRTPLKKALDDIPLDKELRDTLFAQIDEMLLSNSEKANQDIFDYILGNSVTISNEVAKILGETVEKEQVAECSEKFIEAIKAKYNKKEG